MPKPPPVHPMAVAMQWVAQVIAAGMIMVVPGLAGQGLDRKLGTGFLSLVGFAVGVSAAIAYLIAITQRIDKQKRTKQKHTRQNEDEA